MTTPQRRLQSTTTAASEAAKDEELDVHGAVQERVLTHPSRPDLFYHLLDPPTPISLDEPAYAMSFLEELDDLAAKSAAGSVLGWIPARKAETGMTGWEEFGENPAFMPILHETIYAAIRDCIDPVWVNGAINIGDGWMHIYDQRNPPPAGRIPTPDDIIGTVLVQDGVAQADTYQKCPSYRLYSPEYGLLQLTPHLHERLLQSLGRVTSVEKGSVSP